MEYVLNRKLALASVAALLVSQPGCSGSVGPEDPLPPADVPAPIDGLHPLLFFTANVETNDLALRVVRSDASTALLATRKVQPQYQELFEGYRYTGVRDRRGTFPYMSPYWLNASASPDGSWVLWKREDSSWDVLDGRSGAAIALPNTRWEDSAIKWSPDGKRFVGLELEKCALQAVTPGEARVDRLAEFDPALCSNTDFHVEFFFNADGSKVAHVSYLPVHGPTAFRNGELHVTNADGTGDRIVHRRAQICRAGSPGSVERANPWSPFRDQLAFAALSAEQEEAHRTIAFHIDGPDQARSWPSFQVPSPDDGSQSSVVCEWSPRGDRALFGTGSGLRSFWTEGGTPEPLILSSWGDLAFSGDGAWLSFAEYTGSGRKLHVARTDGTGGRVIGEFDSGDAYGEVAWSSATALHGASRAPGEPYALYLYDFGHGRELLSSAAGWRYAWTPRAGRALYQNAPSCGQPDPTCELATALADGSNEQVFTVSAMSVPELIWLDGGDHVAGADDEGLWIQNVAVGDHERRTLWASKGNNVLVDYASWDHALVW